MRYLLIAMLVLLSVFVYAECGDGFLDIGEQCDAGAGNENRDCMASASVVGQCTEWCVCESGQPQDDIQFSPERDTIYFMSSLFLICLCVGVILHYIHKDP